MDKRTFIKQFSILTAATLPVTKALAQLSEEVAQVPLDVLAEDEEFWLKIRALYKIKADYINLENGYYCMMPEPILDKYLNHVKHINTEASFYMRTVMTENKLAIRKKLADMAGVSFEELVVTRNTTESLDLVIGGMHWNAGDEAIMAEQDYGAMLNHFRLMNERYGVVNKVISLPNHPVSDEEIIKLYEDQITDKTKLLMVCHMVNITGQVLPVQKICKMAHNKGVEVMVDGAHSFAHLNVKISELGCDYYGASLHKWLSAPLGAGLLWVKKDKIKKLWPVFAEDIKADDDILRLNHTGTTPIHVELGLSNAIDLHLAIGPEKKEKRLKFLKQHWTEQVKGEPKIIVNTPWETDRHGAIANVLIEGMKASDMAKELIDNYKIWTVAINRPGVHGCRITPNLFTTTEELDQFVVALKAMAK